MAGSILGSAVKRREDPRLVTGTGRYTTDVAEPGMLHATFVRSSMAHARIAGIDAEAARRMPGVAGVFAASDLGLEPIMEIAVYPREFGRPPLAADRVRFVGEAVAIVVADTPYQAADAALAVGVDYDPLPAVVDPERAVEEGSPLLFEDAGTNVAFTAGGSGEDVLEGAEVVVRTRLRNQRVAAVPLEGSAIVASPSDGKVDVWISLQSAFNARDEIAGALGMDESDLHVVIPDVGGGFGAKIHANPEHAVVVAAARKLGRPVRWVETRSENLVSMWHGRGQVQEVEIGARADGTVVGLRARVICEAGAYPGLGAFLPIFTGQMLSGVYRFPRVEFASRSVVTNTTPTSAYRGAGRPEAATLVERAMDLLARRLQMDPAELRRRNFIAPDEFPFQTVTGATYDSGRYADALDAALAAAGYDQVRRDQAGRRESGATPLLGIGLCTYVEVTAVGESSEYASVEVGRDGVAVVTSGVVPTGQGHETALAQIAASELGLPLDRVRVVLGDTAAMPRGGGTSGSRSVQLGGSAVVERAAEVREQAKAIAADTLEAALEDVVMFDDGTFGVAGAPARALTWEQIAAAAPAPLRAAGDFTQNDTTYPFGCHVAVVEVDPETGEVRLLRHIAVDDCGTIINPLLAAGQVQGGVAQGIAQAVFEEVLYDSEGNPRSASLLDYSVPTANEMPEIVTEHTVTPTPLNPLGAKGIGESGTIGSTAAVWNAVLDALAPLGVEHVDMPLSPDRVWSAVNALRYGGRDGEDR